MIKYKLALYSPVKDETRLNEWILYYKKLGINLFIILDDFSEISPKVYFEELNMTNYVIIKADKPNWDYKTLRRNVSGSYIRTKIFDDHIIPICKKHNIDYLLHFDSDEFLYLNKFKNIQEMINYYQPFDELNINWLVFSDMCLKENKTNSLIKSSNKSGKYLNVYTKSITKVSSIITGRNAHNCLKKENSVIKNILNEIIPSLENNCGLELGNFSYKDAPIFIAHYVYKDITNYVEKKLTTIDGNFNSIFNKWQFCDPNDQKILEKKQTLIKYHIEHKNDLIDYIYALRKKINDDITRLEKKHPIFRENKEYYKRYYTFYGHDFENKLLDGTNYYVENNFVINIHF